MTTLARELRAAARLDFGDALRSRWLPFSTLVYAALAGVLGFAATRESSVFAYTGTSRVLISFAHALLFVLPMLALTATSQTVVRAREDGTMELLFSHPISRGAYLGSLALVRTFVVVVPLALLVIALALVARIVFGEAVPWAMLARALAVSLALAWAFLGLGMAVSTGAPTQARAVVGALVLWALSVVMLDLAVIGLLLQWRVDARSLFVLASLNPVQAARLALLSGLEPDLGTLGPVGFYLAQRVGAGTLLALGIAWPLTIGSAAFAWAMARFRRGDLL